MNQDPLQAREAYSVWAAQYDQNQNRTRDLEGLALRTVLQQISFRSCLEIGCGTGKNTGWLAEQASEIRSVDFSAEMLAKAREKVTSPHVRFVQADIKEPWTFAESCSYGLVSFSLVLEHIEALEPVLAKAYAALQPGGYMYIGELHPFKQYLGSKARFETEGGVQIVECYQHHVSDFVEPALRQGFRLVRLDEFFDDQNRQEVPRLLTLLFQKEG